jgi:hypothetical protein
MFSLVGSRTTGMGMVLNWIGLLLEDLRVDVAGRDLMMVLVVLAENQSDRK